MHDVLVAGGGIVGLATARALALRGLSVVVLEREAQLGRHQTTHNSGVIHAGIYYAPGSLKARLCVQGAAALYEYCADRGIEAVRCGKLVVAVRDDDLPRLDELERRARANGVQGLERLGPDEIPAIEPHARGLSALHSPNTGMVDFGAVAAAYAADVEATGGEIRRGAPVAALVEREDHVEAVLAGGAVRRGAASGQAGG
ncbi:MAG TPA: FAD-dependent oxidoreductase, partial [Solirubrobacteraceae bacterium]|nr:FAD-dependent oxidoreductase [Solirubrobacteraceae bacterium]